MKRHQGVKDCVDYGKWTTSFCVRCDEPCCFKCQDAGFICESCSRIERVEQREATKRRLELEELERD